MFTGLIEDVGRIGALRFKHGSAVLTVKTKLAVRRIALGASVAVNGACLTVVKKLSGAFTVDVSPETLARTNLETLSLGSLVNLEQPMRLQERLGGHLVTGHVDGVGTVDEVREEGFSRVTWEIAATESGFSRLTVTHELEGKPIMAALVSSRFSESGSGGWSWILSDLKSVLETGRAMGQLTPSHANADPGSG